MSTWSTSRRLQRAFNIDDLRELARRRLPRFIFDYLDGGADDEYTRGENAKSFAALSLLQRVLVDVTSVDTSTTLLGMPTSIVVGTSLFQIVFVTANVTLLQAINNQTVDILSLIHI